MTATRAVPIRGNDPLIVALDVTASMSVGVPADGDTRMSRAKLTLSDLIKRLPRDTLVTVLAVGADVHELARNAMPVQARAALLLAEPNTVACCAGMALERCFMGLLRTHVDAGYERANFVLVTDGPPSDWMRWNAWCAFNRNENSPLTITVLTCGEQRVYDVSGARDIVVPLDEVEFQISTTTGSDRPGDTELAKRPTAPPSLSPPDAPALLAGDHQSARHAADAVALNDDDFMRTEVVSTGPEHAGSFDPPPKPAPAPPAPPPGASSQRPTKPERGGYMKGKSTKHK